MKKRTIVIIILVLAAVVGLTISMVSCVPTGYTGIVTTYGKVEDGTLSAGAHFKLPWQKVVNMDNRTQKVQVQTQAFSSDIQQVNLQLSVNYCIDQETAQTLYKTVGLNYYDNVLYPRILENAKSVFSEYNAEALVANREKLSSRVLELLTADAQAYGIKIVSMSIEDIDFTDAFTNAVEAKQVAAQDKLTAQTRQEQLTMEQQAQAERALIMANTQAEQDIIAAEAKLEVERRQADANLYKGQKEAEANKLLAESLTEELIRYFQIKQWNGQMPTTMLGAMNGSFMIPLPE